LKSEILYQDDNHKWVVIGRDPDKSENIIDTNEYLIVNGDQAMILDPGGIEIYPQVITELSKFIRPENIKIIFASHQDPDIASSLPLWVDICPGVKIYCSWLWTSFIAHFAMGSQLDLIGIPDDGMEVKLGNSSLYYVPAHYCHSSGNFSVYDPVADILFSGDIGAALIEEQYPLIVQDFEAHIKYMEGFHRRWMASSEALRAWVRRVRAINPSMIAPQHGSIFKGKDVEKFLNWLENLEVGKYKADAEQRDINSAPWMKWKK
jgi:flavorubredoxin